MSLETDLYDLLAPLADGHAYPDVFPDDPDFPAICFQQIGGEALWLSERAMPSHKHARMQLSTWAKTRLEANTLARAAEARLCNSSLIVRPYGAFTAAFNELPKLYGTRQDFGIWYID